MIKMNNATKRTAHVFSWVLSLCLSLAICLSCNATAAAAENTLIFATKDTHSENYMETREGRFLPVPHCIQGTDGWDIRPEVKAALGDARVIEKYSFGSRELPDAVAEALQIRGVAEKDAEIELKVAVDPAAPSGFFKVIRN